MKPKYYLSQICELDRKIRIKFVKTLIEIEDELGIRLSRNDIGQIDSGSSFRGINVWKRAYEKYEKELKEEKILIAQFNDLVRQGAKVDFGSLIFFFGYMGGYHERFVHGKGIFVEGNSGYYFIQNMRRLNGWLRKGGKGKLFWRGILAFQNFCIAYYRLLADSKILRKHFEKHEKDTFDSFRFPLPRIEQMTREILNFFDENPDQNLIVFENRIAKIYPSMKEVVGGILPYYPKLVMETLAEVEDNFRIKQLQCRIAEGPLTPSDLTSEPYPKNEVIEYHHGTRITKFARI